MRVLANLSGSGCPGLGELLTKGEDVSRAVEDIDLADELLQAQHPAIVGNQPLKLDGVLVRPDALAPTVRKVISSTPRSRWSGV